MSIVRSAAINESYIFVGGEGDASRAATRSSQAPLAVRDGSATENERDVVASSIEADPDLVIVDTKDLQAVPSAVISGAAAAQRARAAEERAAAAKEAAATNAAEVPVNEGGSGLGGMISRGWSRLWGSKAAAAASPVAPASVPASPAAVSPDEVNNAAALGAPTVRSTPPPPPAPPKAVVAASRLTPFNTGIGGALPEDVVAALQAISNALQGAIATGDEVTYQAALAEQMEAFGAVRRPRFAVLAPTPAVPAGDGTIPTNVAHWYLNAVAEKQVFDAVVHKSANKGDGADVAQAAIEAVGAILTHADVFAPDFSDDSKFVAQLTTVTLSPGLLASQSGGTGPSGTTTAAAETDGICPSAAAFTTLGYIARSYPSALRSQAQALWHAAFRSWEWAVGEGDHAPAQPGDAPSEAAAALTCMTAAVADPGVRRAFPVEQGVAALMALLGAKQPRGMRLAAARLIAELAVPDNADPDTFEPWPELTKAFLKAGGLDLLGEMVSSTTDAQLAADGLWAVGAIFAGQGDLFFEAPVIEAQRNALAGALASGLLCQTPYWGSESDEYFAYLASLVLTRMAARSERFADWVNNQPLILTPLRIDPQLAAWAPYKAQAAVALKAVTHGGESANPVGHPGPLSENRNRIGTLLHDYHTTEWVAETLEAHKDWLCPLEPYDTDASDDGVSAATDAEAALAVADAPAAAAASAVETVFVAAQEIRSGQVKKPLQLPAEGEGKVVLLAPEWPYRYGCYVMSPDPQGVTVAAKSSLGLATTCQPPAPGSGLIAAVDTGPGSRHNGPSVITQALMNDLPVDEKRERLKAEQVIWTVKNLSTEPQAVEVVVGRF